MAQSAKNGHIELKLVVDNSSFKSGLEGAKKALGGLSSESLRAENGLQKATQGLRGLSNSGAVAGIDRLKTAFIGLQSVIATVAAVGVGILTKNLIDAASEAQETANKFNVTFSGIRKEADLTADNLAKNFGLANDEAQALLSNTGDLLTGFGFTQESALALSDATNKLAVDLASFTNYSGGAKGASEALTKALLGERESIKSLGIAILEEDVKAKIKSLEVTGELTNETEREKRAIATLAIAYEQAKNSVGDFARSQFEYANQIRVTDSIVRNLTVGLGKGLLPAVTEMRKAFNLLAKENGEKLINAFKQIIEFSGGIAKAIGGIVQVFKPLVPIVLEFAGTALSLIKYIGIGLDAVLSTLADFVRVLSAAGVAMSKFIKGDFNFADNFKAELDKTESYLKQFVDRVNNGYNPQVSAEINTPGKSNANKTPAGGEVVNEEALKSYEKIKDALSKEAYDLQLDSQVRNLLGIPSEMEIGERLQVSFDLIKEYLAKEREITLSDAKNKGELYLQLQNVYKEKEIQSLKEYDKKYLEEKQADEIKGQEIIANAKFGALQNNYKVTQEVLQNNIKRLGDLSRNVFQTMTQSGLSFGERMRNVFQELLFYMAKMSAIQAFTGMAASGGGSGILGTIGKIGVSALTGFADGGITPGSFGQPVPILSHAGEWNVNPKGQEEILKTVRNAAGGGGQPVIVHNSFTINAMDGRSVERMLIEKREFINGMVADGIRKGGGLKAAVRGA